MEIINKSTCYRISYVSKQRAKASNYQSIDVTPTIADKLLNTMYSTRYVNMKPEFFYRKYTFIAWKW